MAKQGTRRAEMRNRARVNKANSMSHPGGRSKYARKKKFCDKYEVSAWTFLKLPPHRKPWA